MMAPSLFPLIRRMVPLLAVLLLTAPLARAQHPAINLMDVEGNIIDPINGENAEAPFSTKMTCGMCHDYDEITQGYHFQMGWDVVSDDFGVADDHAGAGSGRHADPESEFDDVAVG